MLKVLLKKQLLELNRGFLQNKKTGELRSKKSTIVMVLSFLVLFGMISFAFVGIGSLLIDSFHLVDMDWMYFFMMFSMAIMLGAFGSVFNTYASLYKAGDNDLLFSMPISAYTIILARLLSVYLLGLLYSLIAAIPTLIVYWVKVGATFLTALGQVLCVGIISLFVLAISVALGYIVAVVSSKIHSKTFVSVLCTLLFLFVYYFAYFKMNELIRTVAENAEHYGEKFRSSTFFLYHLAYGAQGDIKSVLIALAITLALLFIIILVLRRSFFKIATKTEKSKHKKGRTTIKTSSLKSALLKKELKRFATSTNYMMNCGLGLIIMPVLAVFALIKADAMNELLGGMPADLGIFANVFPLIPACSICAICSLNAISAPSVSLEGKSIWVLQSLPVEEKLIIEAKVNAHVLLNSIPAVISTALLGIAFRLDVVGIVLSCCVVWMFIWFDAGFGLVENLKHCNLVWTSEVVPVKQGLSVFLSLLVGFAVTMIMLGASIFVCEYVSMYVYMVILVAVLMIFNLAEQRWLNNKGSKIFKTL